MIQCKTGTPTDIEVHAWTCTSPSRLPWSSMDCDRESGREDCEAPLLHAYTQAEVDAVYRRIAWRLVPACFLMTVVCYVDRTNISLAAIDMSADSGLTKSEFGVASSLFFVTCVIFQIPSNEVLKRVGGPLWLGVLLIGWGVAASLTALVKNVTQLYTLRLLLGAFEAGTFPGLLYYLAQFFPESQTPAVYGVTLAGCTAGMGISAPLAAGILSMDGVFKIRGWQWLFFLEGMPAILLGVWMMLRLPKYLNSEGFLTEKEHRILNSDRPAHWGPAEKKSTDPMYLVRSVVLNITIWVLMLCDFLAGLMRHTAIFWTPLWIDAMVNGSGLDWEKGQKKTGDPDSGNGVQVALLSAIPYALAAFSSILFGWTSEKLRDRTIHCFALWLSGGLFFLLLPWLAGVNVILGFVALLCGQFGANGKGGPFNSLTLSFMTSENKSFGLAWMNSVGNLSGLLGPLITGFLADRTGSYKSAIWGTAGLSVVAAIVIIHIKDVVRNEHRRT